MPHAPRLPRIILARRAPTLAMNHKSRLDKRQAERIEAVNK